MLCIWWDQMGVLYYELLKPGETINGVRYRIQLIRLKRAIKNSQKRTGYPGRFLTNLHVGNITKPAWRFWRVPGRIARPHSRPESQKLGQKSKKVFFFLAFFVSISVLKGPSDFFFSIRKISSQKVDFATQCELHYFCAQGDAVFYLDSSWKLLY